jgi:uncharacterized protein YbjT (DUF2867 family)
MAEKKVIAVVGATGAQGGGLARAILADHDGPFAVRGLTRNAGSDAARELAAQGVEVVQADLDDESSVRKAFDGAYGAFVMTNFWDQRSPEQQRTRTAAETELAQAQAAARAAKDAGLKHVIWSTLEDTRPHFATSGSELPGTDGKYTVPHFDAKAEANATFTDLGVPVTFLQTTMFYGMFAVHHPHPGPDGGLVLNLAIGDRKLAVIAVEDVGKTSLGIFRNPGEFIGTTVSIAAEILTGQEIAAIFSRVFGERVLYQPITFDQLRSFRSAEAGNMFQYFYEAADSFTGARDLDLVRRLNPELQSLESWLRAHKDIIPLD